MSLILVGKGKWFVFNKDELLLYSCNSNMKDRYDNIEASKIILRLVCYIRINL